MPHVIDLQPLRTAARQKIGLGGRRLTIKSLEKRKLRPSEGEKYLNQLQFSKLSIRVERGVVSAWEWYRNVWTDSRQVSFYSFGELRHEMLEIEKFPSCGDCVKLNMKTV